MDSIPGDRWIGEYARWLRVHEAKLGDVAASAAAAKRNATKQAKASDAAASTLSSTFWNVVSLGTAGASTKDTAPSASTLAARPMLLRQNPHNLFYLLIRFEELGLPSGSLDTQIPIAARPTSYFSFVAATAASTDRDDTMSMSSMRSRMSVVSSSLSSSMSWFGTNTKPDPSKDVKYIYSCFTKIPSLRLGPIPARKLIQDFEDCPGQSAVPLDVFKNLQMLELDDVDPRTLIGWDRVCIQLRSLTCKKSNIEDLTDLLVDLVVLDTKRRRGEKVDLRRLRRAAPPGDAVQDLPASNTDVDDAATDTSIEPSASTSTSGDRAAAQEVIPTLPADLPSLAWHFLRYLNLSLNNLTFVPVEPLLCLSGLTHLDLSSNLLNVVPPSLSHLPALTSLNISDNLIDSVLGIYDALPAIRVLNLAKNRLESLCGLERLFTLQRIDLRSNAIYEAGEVGRLAPLKRIEEVWVKDNPLVEELVDYRVECFAEFAMEGRSVVLDGEPAGFFERQRVAERVPNAGVVFAGQSSGGFDSGESNSWSKGKLTREEEHEAQLAKDVATTSSTVVKNVRHRATSRLAHAERGTGSELLAVPGSSTAGDAKSRSRSTSGNRAQNGSSTPQGAGRRRNQRVVELDSSPKKPSAAPHRQRTLTESDRIKQAALSGNRRAAMDGDELANEIKVDATNRSAAGKTSNGKAAVDHDLNPETQLQAADSQQGKASTDTSEADKLAAHSTMLFALPPALTATDNTTPRSEAKPRTFTSRRNPIESSTIGRKSAARPLASDLFATSNSATDSRNKDDSGGDTDDAAVLARQRIARPREGSTAALARRSRVTTSLYDPDLAAEQEVRSSAGLSGVAEETHVGAESKTDRTGSSSQQQQHYSTTTPSGSATNADAFRRRIEALKSEVGDDWLRLLARGGGASEDNRMSRALLASVSEEAASRAAETAATPTTSGTEEAEETGQRADGKVSRGGEASEQATRVVRAKKKKARRRSATDRRHQQSEADSSV